MNEMPVSLSIRLSDTELGMSSLETPSIDIIPILKYKMYLHSSSDVA